MLKESSKGMTVFRVTFPVEAVNEKAQYIEENSAQTSRGIER